MHKIDHRPAQLPQRHGQYNILQSHRQPDPPADHRERLKGLGERHHQAAHKNPGAHPEYSQRRMAQKRNPAAGGPERERDLTIVGLGAAGP